MILAGIDEAGYGPLLGPLVVSASAFALPGEMGDQDFSAAESLWPQLERAIVRKGPLRSGRLIVADSKLVHAMAGGLGLLERTVLAMRRQLPVAPLPENSPLTLWTFLEALKLPRNPSRANSRQQPLLPQPWYRQGAQNGGQLPVFTQADSLGIATSMLAGTMGTAGVTLAGLWSYVLDEDMFNTQVRATGNKATVLTSATFTHIAHLAECFAGIGLLLVVDKQGGRAHYVPLLLRTFPDWQIKILAETPEESSYYLHHESQRILLTFREKSELTSFPTALASMTSKYIRELLMEAFNQWWCQRVPGLKPTAGYYQDGRRWLKDVQPHLANLGIAQEQLMRIK